MRIRGWLAVSVLLPCCLAQAESTDLVVHGNVDAEAVGRVYYAEHFYLHAPSSPTKGIQEAINACGQGFGTSIKGCTVVLPKGDVLITEGITIGGLTTSTAKSGIVLRGHGAGLRATDTQSGTNWNLGGTNLIWSGEANGTVLTLEGVSHSRFIDFMIDGGQPPTGGAGIGILIKGCNTCSTPSMQNVFQNISIVDIIGSPGHGIEIIGENLVNESTGIAGQKYDDQISENLFEHITVQNSHTAFFHDSSQATNNHLLNATFVDYEYGIYLNDGAVITTNVVFGGSVEPQHLTTADVHVTSSAEDFTAFRNYHETPAGSAYVFSNLDRNGYQCGGSPAGRCRTDSTSLYAPRVLVQYDMCPGDATCGSPIGWAVLHQARGPLTIQGGNFFALGGTEKVPIAVTLDSVKDINQSKTVTTGGNVFASPNYIWKTSYNVGVIGTDLPFTGQVPIASSGALEFWRAGITFTGDSAGTLGSITWKDENKADRFKLYYNSTKLRFLDASNHQIVGIGTVSAPFEFEGATTNGILTNLEVADPTVNRTITLPNRTGTTVLSDDTFIGDVTATLEPDGQTPLTIENAAVEPSDLNATNPPGSTGQCVSKAAGDQFTWASCGGSAPNVFATFDAPAGSDPVADSATDVLVLAKGRSVSVTGDSSTDTLTVAADTELYRRVQSGSFKSVASTDDNVLLFAFEAASTLTRVRCSTTSNSTVINVYRRSETTPNSGGTQIASGSCSTTPTNLSLSSNTVAATEVVTVEIQSTTGTPAALRVQVSYDVND